MIWYVAVIAVVNLALGYAIAALLNGGRGGARSRDAADAGDTAGF